MTFPKRLAENELGSSFNVQNYRDPRMMLTIIGPSWEWNKINSDNLAHRWREIAGPDNLISRYVAPFRTSDTDGSATVSVMSPTHQEVDSYFLGKGINPDGSNGVYLHYLDPNYEDSLTITVTNVSGNQWKFTRVGCGNWPAIPTSQAVHFRGFTGGADGNNYHFQVDSVSNADLTVTYTAPTYSRTAPAAVVGATGITACYRSGVYGGDIGDYYMRIGQEPWLDFVFGAAGGKGKRADGTDSWMLTKCLYEGNWNLVAHENLPFYSASLYPSNGSDPIEVLYGMWTTYYRWEQQVYTYFEAFRDRILIPFGILLYNNRGQHRFWNTGTPDAGKLWRDVMSLIDGLYTESCLSESMQWPPIAPKASDIDDTIYRNLLEFQWLAENNKLGSLIMSNTHKAMRVAKSGGPLFKVVGGVLTLNVETLTLAGQTVAQVKTWLEARGVTVDYTGSNLFASLQPAELLANITVTNLSATPSQVYFSVLPRHTHLRLLAYVYMCGLYPNHKLYVGPGGDSTSYQVAWNDVYYLGDKIGNPDFVTQPKNLNSWDLYKDAKGHGMDVAYAPINTDPLTYCFYRLYSNGVAFFNWSGSEQTIQCNDARWGGHASWYDLRDYRNVLTPGQTGQVTSASITLPDKSGTICLFTL